MESKQLVIGRAGEYLAMYDLLSQGYKCFLTDQGLNYDIVVDLKGTIIRLQVKTTQKPMLINKTYSTKRYLFHARRAGRGSNRIYRLGEFEGFILVTMDTKSVYYYPFNSEIKKTLIFRTHKIPISSKCNRHSPYIEEFTLESFLEGFNAE